MQPATTSSALRAAAPLLRRLATGAGNGSSSQATAAATAAFSTTSTSAAAAAAAAQGEGATSSSSSAAVRWVFLGPPGGGKGTYATRVAAQLGVPHIAAGDLVRAEIKSGSALGKEVRAPFVLLCVFGRFRVCRRRWPQTQHNTTNLQAAVVPAVRPLFTTQQ